MKGLSWPLRKNERGNDGKGGDINLDTFRSILDRCRLVVR